MLESLKASAASSDRRPVVGSDESHQRREALGLLVEETATAASFP
jgi:hypothetical protein